VLWNRQALLSGSKSTSPSPTLRRTFSQPWDSTSRSGLQPKDRMGEGVGVRLFTPHGARPSRHRDDAHRIRQGEYDALAGGGKGPRSAGGGSGMAGFRAEIATPDEILVVADGEAPPPVDVRVRSHDLGPVPAATCRREGGLLRLCFDRPLDLARNWSVAIGGERVWACLSGDLLDREFVCDGPLGAAPMPGGAVFRLWSPPATRVSVHVFDRGDPLREIASRDLVRGERGLWSCELTGSLDGCFYQYEVTAYGNTRRALDPYALSTAAFEPRGPDDIGRAAIVDVRRADPPGFRDDDFSNLGRRGPGRTFVRLRQEAQMVAYELHVRDFTIDPDSPVPDPLRGTYLGFAQPGPLEHLRTLGVTHVQLMPVHAFHTVDEPDRAFRDGRSGLSNYNWGYDPHAFFAPEGWFATDPHDPYARVRELKTLVQALHRARIGVVMDVVFNHVYEAATFENAAPGCYLRSDGRGGHSRATGAGVTLESRRAMTRRLIVDSVRHWTEEYGVDGFRFDLMGFLDHDTMLAIRRAAGEDALLYGEAWEMTDLPRVQAATKRNLPEAARVGAFSDTTRDSIAGRMAGPGFVQGAFHEAPRVRAGVVGNLRKFETLSEISEDGYDRFARGPAETVNYLAIHDGYTLWDKVNLSAGGTTGERAKLVRLATALLFTSQGRIVLHGGDEMGRTKPLAPADPVPDRAHTSALAQEDPDLPGIRRFHENSYCSPDWTNMVRWLRAKQEPFRSIVEWHRSLALMRRSLPGLCYGTAEQVQKGLRFLDGSHPAAHLGGFISFAEVPELTVDFVNGPAGGRLFVAGEVHPAGVADHNPAENPFVVIFDAKGRGRIRFPGEAMARFDSGAWGDSAALNLKLVTEPGKWTTPAGAYSGWGNNRIRPAALRKDGSITVDLAATDHAPGRMAGPAPHFLAWELDNTIGAEGPQLFDRLVVVHNAGRTRAAVMAPVVEDPSRWRVILDDALHLDGEPRRSPVTISAGKVGVPARSPAVIGRLAR